MPDEPPAADLSAAPLDDDARDRRLRLIAWVLFALALVVLVVRGLLIAKGAPAWVSAPLSFPTLVIAALGVQGWRGRSRIRRSIAYVSGMVAAAVVSEVASLLSGLVGGPGARTAALGLTLLAIGLAVVTMLWAGPGRAANSPVVVRAAPSPAARETTSAPRPGAVRRPAPARRPGGPAGRGPRGKRR